MSETQPPKHWISDTTLASQDRLFISKEMLKSKAFIKLTGSAKQILLELYTRLRITKSVNKYKQQKSVSYSATNNGKLEMSYKSITNQFGYSSATTSKALDKLCKHGFIEIAELGSGVHRQSHKIALTTNWKQWNKPDFSPNKGKANKPINKGFQKKSTS
ncbi:MAG: hypothetical protein JEZ07_08065 [Phycisphaerae bacterium]|nr:hypothetical protein [Phycisphaerae bacterium]